MPFESIKSWSYFKALNQLLLSVKKVLSADVKVNPALNYLLFINGSNAEDVRFFQSLHRKFESRGTKIKILAFVQTKGDVTEFSMAVYNESSIRWNYLPKPKLIELVQSRKFDILLNINPDEFRHLHYLAVAADADFKVSTNTDLPNNFSLTIKTRNGLSQQEIFHEMEKCLKTLSH